MISTRTGVSYKALLSDEFALVIKRLSACKLSEKQFRLEINRLGQLRHLNLLHGGSLVDFGNGKFEILDWSTRLRIGVGVARGLAWLHHGCQPPYMHQYFNSNVVLIDDGFDSQITDFGLARLMDLVIRMIVHL
ncbi:hypothetical protein CRYUN_Cryun04dG0134100 [Craigia yunnanensis]